MQWPKIVDRFLPPFAEPKREKPREILYLAHETPPLFATVALGLQHALVALSLVIYLVIVGKAMALPEVQLQNFISLGIVIMALGTLLNCLSTRLSAGHLIVQVPAVLTMAVFISVVAEYGLNAAAGGVLVSGLCVFVLGRFVSRLRIIFPPEVMGVLLVLLGISLLPGGFDRSAGLHGAQAIQSDSALIAVSTLASITALSVWASARLRVLAVFVGISVGLLVATWLGQFGGTQWATVASQRAFALPVGAYSLPTPSFVWGATLPLLLVVIISAVNKVGAGVVMDKMNDKHWVRPDLPMIGRLLYGQGLMHLLSALTGTLPTNFSSANVGLTHATGVASRRVGVAAGVLLLIVAFLPQLIEFFILLPQAVVGAILIYTAAYMIVSGIELIMSRMLNSRRRATVGFSLAVGCAVFTVPELTAFVSPQLRPILGSGLVLGVSFATVMNLLFRIGITSHGKVLLDSPHPGVQAQAFLEDCGADWGARRDVISRAGLAVGEALEALQTAHVMNAPSTLEASFDEYKVILKLVYAGREFGMTSEVEVDWQALLETEGNDAEVDQAMALIPGLLIRNWADQVDSGHRDGSAWLRLQFDH
jgi:xanthine/uracil permease